MPAPGLHPAYPAHAAIVSLPRPAAVLVALSLWPAPLDAQDDVRAPPRLRLTLSPDAVVPRVTVALPVRVLAGLRASPETAGAQWEAAVAAAIARARAERWSARLAESPAPDPVAARPAPGAPPDALAALDALAGLANLGFEMGAHLEMKVDRLRNERCSAQDFVALAAGCRTGFPTPAFDQQFRIRAGGVVSERLHVQLDFDTEREFDANNNIHVWYEGGADDVLRRVDIGNVTFDAPPSRFITTAIPANSFGLQADARVGGLDLRAVMAQHKGSARRTRTFTVGETATQPVDVEARDLDFESGRFFLVVDPTALPGYPAVDLLEPGALVVATDVRPVAVRVYRLRAQLGRTGVGTHLGGIDAVATRPDGPQRVGPFPWELLVEGRDYYLDASGLWFALETRLGPEDFLAVSYVTAAGDTVGTFPATNGQGDTLRLIAEPRQGPEAPTFVHELRNVYRVGGSEVERATVSLELLVNESERPLGGGGTYLSLLGLAAVSDPSDLDRMNRVFPRERDPHRGAPIRDLFVVFPHLRPFADSSRLLPGELNDSLYRTPAYLLATQGPPPTFTLRFHYAATGAGDRSTLSLGAFQLRPGSEQVYVADRRLERGRDYEMDYQLGQVRFLQPDRLFFGPTLVRVEFEEHQVFDLAPKTIVALAATQRLGDAGEVRALGLLQRDRTNLTRPQLGFEPQSSLIGGVGTSLSLVGHGLTRLLDGLPLIETAAPSRLEVNGEMALSVPNPNQAGVAYLEDFQQGGAFVIRLTEDEFQLGSAPASGRGLPATHLDATGVLAPEDAARLVWQNAVQTAQGVVEFNPRDIDSSIVLVGAGFQVEPVLWLTLRPDTVGGGPHPVTGSPRWYRPHSPGPRWRSITQALGGGSGVGVDLSRVEFVEFWVLEDAEQTARRQDAILVLDFGTVFEDAVDFAPTEFRSAGSDTTFTGARAVGVGRLDTEKDTLTNVFNALVDDVGIRGDLVDTIVNAVTGAVVTDLPLCDLGGATRLTVFPRGDLRAGCTRRNGRLDTEDLDGDNRLDVTAGTVQEDLLRFVFRMGDPRYYVRDGVTRLDERGRPETWRLYRIPFRSDTLQIGRPNPRQVRALRLTVVAPDQGGAEEDLFFVLARLRLLGASWLKRADTPIRGLAGARGEPHGAVVASFVSTEHVDLGYTPPPGTTDQADRFGVGFELGQQQVNERALRLQASDLRPGERAEVFVRFTDEADKNFLTYRRLRVWARGRGPGWEEGDLEFYVKVGRDEHNFYLYRTPARTDDWMPEVVVDLERWLALRAAVETAWLRGEPPSGAERCGGDTTAYVACDGPYLVHVRDPGLTPPNLARVSEVAAGMLRVAGNVAIASAELWLNDIRLSDAVGEMGVAAALDVRFAAADVADVSFSYTNRGDRFRQLGERPSYVRETATRLASVFRLDKLLPEAWGVSVPLSLRQVWTGSDPFYLSRGDVRADALPNLRRPGGRATTLELAVRRTKRGDSFAERALLDPLAVRLRRHTSGLTTSLSDIRTTSRELRLEYGLAPAPATTAGAPRFLVGLVDALPDWISESAFGRALRTSRLRLNPYRVRVASTITDHATDRFTFRVPVGLPEDSARRALRGVVHTWVNEVGVEFRPFTTMALRVDYVTVRDLQDYGDTTAVGRLLRAARGRLFGADVGFERSRTFGTSLTVSPVVSTWFRPRIAYASHFALSRDPNAREPVPLSGDTAGGFRAPETLGNFRRRAIGAGFDVARLVQGIAGDASVLTRFVRGLLPADVQLARERRSTFDRTPFAAGLDYQLGLGGLDQFLERDGVPATSTGETVSVSAAGGARLPLGAQVRLSFRDVAGTAWARRGEGRTRFEQVSREWPVVQFSWAYRPRSGLGGVVRAVSAQAQYRVNVTASELVDAGDAAAAGVRAETRTVAVAPSVSLTWAAGITTSASYALATSDAVTAGNVTRGAQESWGASASFAFRPPESLVRLRAPLQTTVGYSSSTRAVCLVRAGSGECRDVSDSRRQQFDVRTDTGLTSEVRGGLTFSYVVTDQRHTSQRLSQVVFALFADIILFAGRL